MTRIEEMIAMLKLIQSQASEHGIFTVNDTVIENVRLESFNWVIDETIRVLKTFDRKET